MTDTKTGYASESARYYDRDAKVVELVKGANGKMVRPDARHVLKHDLVPSVSKIIRAYDNWRLERWNQAQDFLAVYECLRPFLEADYYPKGEYLIKEARDIREAKTNAVFDRGKSFHAAMQAHVLEGCTPLDWSRHVASVVRALEPYRIDLRNGGTPERSFRTRSYGGTCDWHSNAWLLDYKTKDKVSESGKRLAYDEHAMQIAAYIKGLGLSFESCGGVNVFVGVEDAQVRLHWWNVDDLVRCWLKFKRRLEEWWENLE